jgi:hypothetical protein
MATCSSTVYPPAVIASVQQQVRDAKVVYGHPHHDDNGPDGGVAAAAASGNANANANDGDAGSNANDNAPCLPESWRPKPSLLESEFRDSIVRSFNALRIASLLLGQCERRI